MRSLSTNEMTQVAGGIDEQNLVPALAVMFGSGAFTGAAVVGAVLLQPSFTVVAGVLTAYGIAATAALYAFNLNPELVENIDQIIKRISAKE